MHSSELEDFLEAVLRFSTESIPIDGEKIGEHLNLDEKSLHNIENRLISEGKITRDSKGLLALTNEGRIIAMKVERKHRTLECFLTEMLGIDSESASEEACRLEHEVSDETIDRLSSYIVKPCAQFGLGRFGRHHGPEKAFDSILDRPEGAEVTVVMVRGLGRNRRLIDLGIFPGEHIIIRRKLRNGSVMVQVKGCDVALSPEVAQMIFVE